jgi:hypothetical protein
MSIIPMDFVVEFFAEGSPYSVRVPPSKFEVNADGFPTKPAAPETVESHTMHVWPADGKVVDQVPEGYRTRRLVMVHDTQRMAISDEQSGVRGAEFDYDGDTFTPVAFRRYGNGQVFEYIAASVVRRPT